MTQKFILFDHNGIPLRAKVDVTFTQHKSEKDDYGGSVAGGSAPTIESLSVTPKPGERLDTIAAQETGDPANWRQIAQANNITNPLAMRPHQPLRL